MKLKDHSGTEKRGHKIWPPQWGALEVKSGREHPNMRREEFARQATIDSAIEIRERCGVLINVSHPEYAGERVTGTFTFREDTPENRKLAENLVKVVERFRGKTVEELGEAEVNDDLE